MSDLKAFNAMAKAIATLPPETRLEILDALEEDLEFIKELAEQSHLNYLAYDEKVASAVKRKLKDPNGKNYTRWDMQDAHMQGAYMARRNMQYGIQNLVNDAKQTLQAEITTTTTTKEH